MGGYHTPVPVHWRRRVQYSTVRSEINHLKSLFVIKIVFLSYIVKGYACCDRNALPMYFVRDILARKEFKCI